MAQPHLLVIAHYLALPGNGDRVAELLAELAMHTRQEDANTAYTVSRSIENPNHFVIVEKYNCENGLEAHRNTPHFKQLGVQQIIPMLEKREVETHLLPSTV